VIVTTPQDVSLIDARKGLAMFQKVSVPLLGIIENMSFYVCPQCGHLREIFKHGGGRRTAEKLKVPFLGEIPLDPKSSREAIPEDRSWRGSPTASSRVRTGRSRNRLRSSSASP
jgi:Mrp family chromosome partitioning ATPase